MKKAVKVLAVLVFVLVLVVVVAVGGVFYYIDSIAKTGIERGATYALDVPTTLGSADVRVLSGGFGMSGLNVANPEGFKTPHFLSLGEGGVDVSLGTLRKEVVELSELSLRDIDVNLELSGTNSNYKVILGNLKRLESGGSKEPSASQGGGKKFMIRRVEINNINAHASLLPIGGSLTTVDVSVPEIILTDVGENGVSMSQLVNVLTQAILTSIVKVGGGIIPTDILGDLQGQLAQLDALGDVGVQVLDNAGQVIAQYGQSASDMTKGAQDAVDDAKKQADDALGGVKDLFGNKKDDEK